jgi:hypothetical protein
MNYKNLNNMDTPQLREEYVKIRAKTIKEANYFDYPLTQMQFNSLVRDRMSFFENVLSPISWVREACNLHDSLINSLAEEEERLWEHMEEQTLSYGTY